MKALEYVYVVCTLGCSDSIDFSLSQSDRCEVLT